jgi:dipeptidyl aminopeptidase/acylaminoacyl peptidase
MKTVQYSDLYQYHFTSNTLLSPDGLHLVYEVDQADQKSNSYLSHLVIADLTDGSSRDLTHGPKDKAAFWLDDDTFIFTSSGRQEGAGSKEATYYYKISISGGEASLWKKLPYKAGSLKLISGDMFAATEVRDASKEDPLVLKDTDSQSGKAEQETDKIPEAVEGKDYWVFDEFPFWFNGRGVINKKRNTLLLHKNGETLALSPRYMDVLGWDLSPDKTRIAYTGRQYSQMQPRVCGLYLYDIASGMTTAILPQAGYSVGSVHFCGNDKIFYTALAEEKRGDNSDYYLYDIASDRHQKLPFPDADPHGGLALDSVLGGGQSMLFDDGWLYFCQTRESHVRLCRMKADGSDEDGTIETVTDRFATINSFDLKEGRLVLSALMDMHLPEVYLLKEEGQTRELIQLSHQNTDYEKEHYILTPETFSMTDRDGVRLEGFVIKPLGFEEGKKYPGILEMHGGPKGAFGPAFHHEMQCYAQMGYFVFFTNPRGSDGRGDDFARINGLLGTIDYNDFMDFTDEVIRRYPQLDEKKIGICGGSYGGYMCNWMIGHTDRFAAAASQRSISNYLTKLLCTDIGVPYNLPQVGADPWEDFEKVWEISPLKAAPKAKTPTLFIQSDEDYRCWQSGAFQMFNALMMNGTPARIALFHGETHELSRSGRPRNRVSRLKEMGDWFDRYLKENS